MNTSKAKTIAITVLVLFLAGLLLFFADAEAWLAGLVLTTLTFVVPITVEIIQMINEEKHIVIDCETNTAILLQRSKKSASQLHCIEMRNYDYKNHDAEIVYTGASSGGIHMGGFHTTKAYTSMTSTGKSGRAYISADYKGESKIEKIKLTPEMLKEAKKDRRIKKLIEKDCIIIENKGEETELTSLERTKLLYAREKNDLALQYKAVERASLASYLPTSDIKYIISWVSGE